jgi:hypothetical protein
MNTAMEPFSFLAGRQVLGVETEGWDLDQPSADGADRRLRVKVGFASPFRSAPLVHLGLCGFDISEHDCARLTVEAQNVTREGFEIVLGTWFNTRLWRVEVNWLALGA